ncbi:5391_t:CDS:10 [Diversispora eburnea]|uniref:5391_t:CDS:1 n=1 Tax=Diversispora eburnea TaxID=1213867 RepID=A0A9N8V7M0_9GLOM|nr:5391_t:CDS:10 [Diversispora eburnea]
MYKNLYFHHHTKIRKVSLLKHLFNVQFFRSHHNNSCGNYDNYSLPSILSFKLVINHARNQPFNKPAIIDFKAGTQNSYQNLISDMIEFKTRLLSKESKKKDLNEARIAFLFPNGYEYVVSQWSIWSAGGIAVPLYSQASKIVVHPEYYDKIKDIAKDAKIDNVLVYESKKKQKDDKSDFKIPSLFPMDINRRALIIYTSGTTGKPKGVVLTHANIQAQINSLIEAWKYNETDKILHVLPLHHMHGILNALNCTLFAGGTVEMMKKFDAELVWNRFMRPERDLTLFMAVPTIYSKLIQHYKNNILPEKQSLATESCSQFRLMVSGSAPLPNFIRNQWKEISGQVLLERYGMSEIGMGLSHEYEIEKRYEVRLMSEDGKDITNTYEQPEELQIKGPNVFKEYWNKPEETKKEFTEDGWFKTGDIAMKTEKEKVFKILGRSSVDIIKSGAYKLSALEIENSLQAHPNILEIVIVGVEDQVWGQKVAALIKLKDPKLNLDLQQLREYAKTNLASYKIPSLLKVVDEIPRNAMGKVNKKELVKYFD